MPGGVVFLVCIPTLSYEHELIFGAPSKRSKKNEKPGKQAAASKVNLRLKQTKSKTQLLTLDDNDDDVADPNDDLDGIRHRRAPDRGTSGQRGKGPVFVSMETVI